MRLRNLFLISTLFLLVVLMGVGYIKYSTKPAPVVVAAGKMAVVVTNGLGAGALIKPQDLAFAPEPPDSIPGVYFERVAAAPGPDQDAADRNTISQIVGAVVRRRLDQGTTIPRDAVVKPGDSGFLAAVLQPGMQAITIGVTAVSGAGGLIYPGDRVDVILTQTFPQSAAPGPSDQHRFGAEPVVQNVRVLAIDQQLQTNASPTVGKLAQTVTVEVSPQQAEGVVLASKLGDLSLSIRSLLQSAEKPEQQTGPVWAEDISPALKAVEQAQRSQTVAPKATPVLIIRGASDPQPSIPDGTTAAPGASVTSLPTPHNSDQPQVPITVTLAPAGTKH